MTIWLHLSWLSRGKLSLEGHFNVHSIRGMSVMKVVSNLSVSRNLQVNRNGVSYTDILFSTFRGCVFLLFVCYHLFLACELQPPAFLLFVLLYLLLPVCSLCFCVALLKWMTHLASVEVGSVMCTKWRQLRCFLPHPRIVSFSCCVFSGISHAPLERETGITS